MESILATTSGYLHPQYAASLAEFGVPRELPRSGGWILERPIPGTAFADAMGCYPLFACRDWSQLAADLEEIAEDLVCLSVVTDPFGEYDEALLQECFPDKVVPFKKHFRVDLERPMDEYVQREHRRNARRALKRLHVEWCRDDAQAKDDWTRLYEHLIERHGITGHPSFFSDGVRPAVPGPGTRRLPGLAPGRDGRPWPCYTSRTVLPTFISAPAARSAMRWMRRPPCTGA